MSRREHVSVVDERPPAVELPVVSEQAHPRILVDLRLFASHNAVFPVC